MNTISTQDERLVVFFKALADGTRLKMIGLLAQHTYSVEELAALLHLRPSTISHHLSRLAAAGLVSARAESYYNVYRLEEKVLEGIAEQFFSRNSLPAIASEVDADAYDRKVVDDFLLPNRRLKTIPAQRKKREAILRYLVKSFEYGKQYDEQQVNEILSQFHDDTATLRRELIAYRLLTRHAGMYWREKKE